MKHISAHLSGANARQDGASERGDLMRYFLQKLNATRSRDGLALLTMPRMGRLLQAIPTSDLYFLQSICDDAQKRDGIEAFSKKFWWEIKPKADAPRAPTPPRRAKKASPPDPRIRD